MDNDILKPKLPININQKFFILLLLIFLFVVPFIPWVAFTSGSGQVTAINPNERIQTITTPVNGFISHWVVGEGDYVKKNDEIAHVEDVDVDLVKRFQRELNAARDAVNSSSLMLETSKLNLKRQKELFEQGLSSRKEYEKAKIETSKMEVEYSKSQATLAKAETQFSRQVQIIKAPRDGIITRVLPGEKGQLVKTGTPIAVLTPKISTFGVEMWVDGNDIAMISQGQRAILQFEGWPSVQIPGWPSVAIGVFPAKVHLVDAASSYKGKFRVLLLPDGQWPSEKFLRPGAQVKGNIILNQSYLLKEIWRQLTGLPPLIEPIEDELNKMISEKETKSIPEETK